MNQRIQADPASFLAAFAWAGFSLGYEISGMRLGVAVGKLQEVWHELLEYCGAKRRSAPSLAAAVAVTVAPYECLLKYND